MESVETRNKNKQRIKTNQCAPGWARNSDENQTKVWFSCYNTHMFTKENVVKQIKQKHAVELLLYYLMMLFMPGIFLFLFLMTGSRVNVSYVILMTTIGTITTIIVDFIIYKKFIAVTAAKKGTNADPVFRAFTNPDELTAALNEAKQMEAIYEHDTMKVTEKYIVDFKDVRTIMRLDEVVNGYIGRNPNGEGDALFVIDKYDRSCYYSISGDENAAKHVGNILIERCPALREKTTKNDLSA